MYPSLMGTINYPAPLLMIGSSLGRDSSSLSLVHFRTSHLEDPWNLPSPSTLYEKSRLTKMEMPLSTVEVAYQVILDSTIDLGPSSLRTEEEDVFPLPSWEVASSCSHYFLDNFFPLDESILEAMNGP